LDCVNRPKDCPKRVTRVSFSLAFAEQLVCGALCYALGLNMPINYIKTVAKAATNALDVNGDGVVDHRDAIAAVKIAGVATAGVGATAAAGAFSGSAIVATGATAIAAKVTAVVGAAAGGFIAATFGTASATVSIVAIGPSSVLLASSTVSSAVGAKLLAASAATGALIAQGATSMVAGLPVIKSIAISNAIAANEIVIIAGIPMAVNAALVAGLIAIVIVGAYAYYILTKDAVPQGQEGFGSALPA
jgi:hypothetical protein